MTAIILFVETGASEGDPFLPAVIVEVSVNELAAIIRVQSQQRESSRCRTR